MTPMEMVERFAEHVGFDLDRTAFTFTSDGEGGFYSRTFEMDRALRRIPEINECDPTGRLALIYIKRAFESDLRSQKATMFDAIMPPPGVAADAEMWRMFCSPEATAIENDLATLMARVTEQASGRKLLGESGIMATAVADTVERVVDGMHDCKLRVWRTDGSPIVKPTKLPSEIIVFDSVSDAIVQVSRMPDGMCIAYVCQERSTDGFFAIFVKSAGNVVSYDDMLCEAYPGQHGRFRNGRYLEAKSFDFFPYNDIVSFSGSDYKGYATEASVDKRSLPLSELGEDDCIALVLAMSCVAELVSGTVPDAASRMYVTSLSPTSPMLPKGTENGIALREDEAIVVSNDTSSLTAISDEDALYAKGWRPAEQYGDVDAKRAALSILDGSFALDTAPLLGDSEWVANGDTIRDFAMFSARKQVASAFMDELRREFEAWGGMERLDSWWRNSLEARRSEIVDMCARDWARRKQTGDIPDKDDLSSFFNWGFRTEGEPGVRNLRPGEFDAWLHFRGRVVTLNDVERDRNHSWNMFDENGNRCTVAYLFAPFDFADIEAMAGNADVPLIVRLYTRRSADEMFGYAGNDILNVCDPVGFLRNPLRGYTWGGYREQVRDDANTFNFAFQIGFTRRELNALAKRIGKPTDEISNKRG